jgi:antitoxin component of RelBE/YafQ-DinJ toxin-antitoxin module
MLNNRTCIYTDKKLKRELKKRSSELGLSMSEYLRTLLKVNFYNSKIERLNLEAVETIEKVDLLSQRIKRGSL